MSTNGRGAADHSKVPESTSGPAPADADPRRRAEAWQSVGQHGSGYDANSGAGGSRRRRRQRSQRGKPQRPPQGSRGVQLDVVSRERIFQELEGLLRQIREQAEESADWAEDQLSEITRTVTSFTKSLEEQADPIPERARSEYQRIREKLSQALKGTAA